ncbi:hypothetical protein LCGC14_2927480, partial [marine sediment metagenome]
MLLRQSVTNRIAQYESAIKLALTNNEDREAVLLDRDMKRWRCRNDLYYLCCLVGNKEIEKYPEFYQPFCDEVSLQTWQVLKLDMHENNTDLLPFDQVATEAEFFIQRMYLCYRTFYKTTII